MALRKKLIRIDDIIRIAVKLTADLNADATLGGQNRNSIFDQSGIHDFRGEIYTGQDNYQLNAFSLKYKVYEESTPIMRIYDADGSGTIHGRGTKCKRLLLMDTVNLLTKVKVEAWMCPITKKKRQFAESLNIGDRILLDGSVDVHFTHSPTPMTTSQRHHMKDISALLGKELEKPYCGECCISIFV